MAKGSNDLNMLLKAQVVKVRAELDVKGSMPKIKQQVDEISKKLENKPVKLKVKFDISIAELNKQLSALTQKIHDSKTAKTPIKLQVQIDVAGSAKNIKKQLQDVYKTVEEFNKKYGQQLKKMQEANFKAQQQAKSGMGKATSGNGGVLDFNYKAYVSQVNDAKKYMQKQFGKGNFASFEMKDAEGNLKGFIAQFEKANGIVQKIKYQWNADAGKFAPISQETVNTVERNVHKATQSLKSLYSEMEKLQRTKGKANLFKDYDKLEKQSQSGTLTNDAVKDLQRRIKEEQVLQQQIKKENDFLFQQKKLLADIKKASLSVKDVSARPQYGAILKDVRYAKESDELRELRLETDKLTQSLKRKEKADLDSQRMLKERLTLSRELKRLEATVSKDKGMGNYMAETKAIIAQVRSTKELEQAKRRLLSIKDGKWESDMERRMGATVDKVVAKLNRLREVGGITQASFNRHMKTLADNSKKSLQDVERQFDSVSKKLSQQEAQMRADANKVKLLLQGGTKGSFADNNQLSKIKSAVEVGDVALLQEYIGKLYKGKVETVKMTETTDKLGRAVQRLDIKMSGTGKTVKTYTVDLDRANNALRQVSQGVDYNANRNLGVFEQLKIAMARVPVWMASMTAFYGTIHSFQAMGGEILKVDQALTELKRVASDNINIDVVFEGAIGLAKDLGNNIHDVMQTLNDFSRTFGDFNERQLLAITKTATLMSNVSELSAQEAGETLVGTMNAFGIMAEESIRIADSMNEVDNNFAVSTKQLAEGMSKTASTAKTFGVSMEESVGHITAISSVTMESGKVIGNSLKTIYSRITTLSEAEGVLNDVGVGIKDIEGNVRPVQDILGELGGKWKDLTDEERQNIAVKVAGRYQLSRFLALMNNWQTSIDATATALTSEGSAMKENDKYLESFEARINKLKNAFTEMSLAIGDAFLSGAMLAGIEGLMKLAEMATKVAEEFGALPVVLGVVGIIIGLMGKFQFSISGTVERLRNLSAVAPAVASGMTAIGKAFRGILASVGIGILFVGLGMALEKLVGKYQEQKKIAEETEKANKRLIDSYRNTEGGLDTLIAKHAELQEQVDNGKIKEGTEAYNEYLEVNQKVAKALPTMVKYVDSKGVAHLQTADAMKKEYEIAQKLSELEAEAQVDGYKEKLKERVKTVKELSKEIGELAKKQKDLEKSDGGTEIVSVGYGENQSFHEKEIDNTKKIQQTKIEAVKAYQSIQKEIQKINNDIKSTVLASLEADGVLKRMSDTQKNTVESIITNNERFLMDISEKMTKVNPESKEFEKLSKQLESRSQKLFEIGTEVGEMIDSKLSEQLEGIVDDEEIAEVKANFDNILKAVPKSFFSLESLDNADQFKEKLNGIMSVADEIKAGSGDFAGLEDSLKRQGFTADEAKKYVANLGYEYNNSAIKAEVLKQAEQGLIDTTEGFIDVALEATDVTKNLFGYSDTDASALASHIETLQGLKYIYGDNAKNMDAWTTSIETVSLALGVNEEEVEKNLGHYKNQVEMMQNLKFEYNDAGNIIGVETENMTKAQKKYWDELRHQGLDHATMMDIITGKKVLLASGEVVETEATKANTEAKKGNKQAMQEQAEAVEALKGKFTDFQANMNTTTRSAYFDTIKTQLADLDGKINVTKDKSGNLKLAMADGSQSPYLTNLQSQLDTLGIKIGLTEDEAGNLKLVLNDGQGSSTLTTIDKNAKDAKISLDDTVQAVDILNTKKLFPNDFSQINFSKLAEGIDSSIEKVQLLSEALQGVGQNMDAVNAVNKVLAGLKGKADDLKASIQAVLRNSFGDIEQLGAKADGAKKKVNELKDAINKLKGTAKTVNLGGLENLKDDIRGALKALNSLDDTLAEVSASVTGMASDVRSATSRIKDAVNDQKKAVDKLGSEYKDTGKKVTSAFGDMSKSVSSKTSSMIDRHSSHRSAINKLKDSARDARSAISDMLSTAKGAMDGLDRYIARARDAKKAGNSVPSAPSKKLFGLFSTDSNNAPSEGVESAMSTFSASVEGIGGGTGAGGEGSSGTMQTSIYEGGLDFDGNYLANAFELAELVKPNYNEREMTVWNGIINQIQARMNRINKASTTYRDNLKQVLYYQNLTLKTAQKELSITESRNKTINARLKQLGNVSKHTEKQREEYNKLQQEYESNLGKIASLKSEVENTTNDIRNKSVEIFTDFIDEIVAKYDGAIVAIQKKTDDIDFKIDVLGLTDPDNIESQLKLLAEKARSLGEEEQTAENKKNALSSQYTNAVKKYGVSSDQAKKAKADMESASEAWEDAYIKVLQAEKEIKDVRGKVADDGINQLKGYYNNMKDMATKAIDIEKRELEKAHKAKMEMYDKEVEKVNSVYDAKLKSMDEEKAQANYQEELDDKNAKKAELLNKISILSRDNTLEGRKKVEELKKELSSVEEEIADFMEARQDELLRKSLEEQKQKQLEAINVNKETATTEYEGKVEDLDKEKEDITKHYDDILNNDKYWADMRNQFITGNFKTLTSELTSMSADLEKMNKGNFDNLTSNFASFSAEIKKEFAELNKLGIGNMIFNSGSVVDQVDQVGNTSYTKYTGSGTVVATPKETTPPKPAPKPTPPKPAPKPPAKPAPKPAPAPASEYDRKVTTSLNFRSSPTYGNNVIQVLPKDTKVDYIGMEKGWAKIKYKGKTGYVGNQYLKKFDTGGYTGDWAGNDGKVAMLHKKELVLNKKQTSDILNTAKIVDKMKDVIPSLKNRAMDKLDEIKGNLNVTNNYNLTVNIDRLNGDKEGANTVVKEIMKGLKKRGK